MLYLELIRGEHDHLEFDLVFCVIFMPGDYDLEV